MFARNGQVVYGTTAGYADIASGTPMTLGTKFRIASMTKPITAVSAMILVEEGHTLEDPVSNYIPAAANLRVATSQTALPGGGFDHCPRPADDGARPADVLVGHRRGRWQRVGS